MSYFHKRGDQGSTPTTIQLDGPLGPQQLEILAGIFAAQEKQPGQENNGFIMATHAPFSKRTFSPPARDDVLIGIAGEEHPSDSDQSDEEDARVAPYTYAGKQYYLSHAIYATKLLVPSPKEGQPPVTENYHFFVLGERLGTGLKSQVHKAQSVFKKDADSSLTCEVFPEDGGAVIKQQNLSAPSPTLPHQKAEAEAPIDVQLRMQSMACDYNYRVLQFENRRFGYGTPLNYSSKLNVLDHEQGICFSVEPFVKEKQLKKLMKQERFNQLTDHELLKFFETFLLALAQLHTVCIHGDLHSENVYVSENLTVVRFRDFDRSMNKETSFDIEVKPHEDVFNHKERLKSVYGHFLKIYLAWKRSEYGETSPADSPLAKFMQNFTEYCHAIGNYKEKADGCCSEAEYEQYQDAIYPEELIAFINKLRVAAMPEEQCLYIGGDCSVELMLGKGTNAGSKPSQGDEGSVVVVAAAFEPDFEVEYNSDASSSAGSEVEESHRNERPPTNQALMEASKQHVRMQKFVMPISTGGGMLAGVGLGALVGSALGPIGTVVGGAIGAILGGIGAFTLASITTNIFSPKAGIYGRDNASRLPQVEGLDDNTGNRNSSSYGRVAQALPQRGPSPYLSADSQTSSSSVANDSRHPRSAPRGRSPTLLAAPRSRKTNQETNPYTAAGVPPP